MGQEAVGCHAEIRHKLDQHHITTGDEGPGQEKIDGEVKQIALPLNAEILPFTYAGAWSPQYFPINRESSLSPPLKKAT